MDLDDLVLEDHPFVTTEDIKFYDFSAHNIFLKKGLKDYDFNNPFDYGSSLSGRLFVVIASNCRVYLGHFYYSYCSYLGHIPKIVDFGFYGNDWIHIEEAHFWTTYENYRDVRNDYRIKQALIRYGIYKEGIDITLDKVDIISRGDTSTVKYSFYIKNNEQSDIYVPDPDKMGIDLFHGYSRLTLFDGTGYYHRVYKNASESEIDYSLDLSLYTKIKSKEVIKKNVTLRGFHYIPDGNYKCNFYFSTPSSFSIPENSGILNDSRIWIGHISSNIINIKVGN